MRLWAGLESAQRILCGVDAHFEPCYMVRVVPGDILQADGFQFVPGMSGGDVSCGGSGEQDGVRGDANAPEIQTVGVEADGEGRIDLRCGTVMNLAGGDEELHAGVVEVEVSCLAEFERQLRAARTVHGVGIFVFPTGIMEQREKPDNLLVGGMMPAEIEAVAQDRAPVARAMVGVSAEAELGGDELPEWKFGRGEHVVGDTAGVIPGNTATIKPSQSAVCFDCLTKRSIAARPRF